MRCKRFSSFATGRFNRRDWLASAGAGFGGLALAAILADRGKAGDGTISKTSDPRSTHFTPKVKRVIHVFLEGGPSHVDLFDPKPELTRQDGKPIPVPGENRKAPAFGSPFPFARRGQSGLEISNALPLLGNLADDLCVIRSMHCEEAAHETAMLLMNCGNARLARPSVGSWITYGLGREDQNLPEFVVLYNSNPPVKGVENWQAAFLPATCQATAVDTQHRDVSRLLENIHSPFAAAAEQRLQLDLLNDLNRRHAAQRTDDPRLEARIKSFELAYRMQTEATDAFDVDASRFAFVAVWRHARGAAMPDGSTPDRTRVRFVQVYNPGWDHHDTLVEICANRPRPAPRNCRTTDRLEAARPPAETLVVIGGEFGVPRLPTGSSFPRRSAEVITTGASRPSWPGAVSGRIRPWQDRSIRLSGSRKQSSCP